MATDTYYYLPGYTGANKPDAKAMVPDRSEGGGGGGQSRGMGAVEVLGWPT